jgi:hypothetical protein
MDSAMDKDVVGAAASGCIHRLELPPPILAANNHAQPHFGDSC